VGSIWLGIWVAVLWTVAAPWRDLGGLVDERLRWLEWFVLLCGLSVGFTLGRLGRMHAEGGGAFTHLAFLRFLLYPLAGLTAVSLLVLTYLGERGPVGVVVTAFLAYWAGIDMAWGAVPLIDGQPYTLDRPLPVEPRETRERWGRPEDDWVPPWERF